MKQDRRKQLAKIAYLYYIEGKNQAEIAAETGIYRTTVSRMLAKAKSEGIVKIEIENFDKRLYQLEKYIKDKYHLKGIEIVENNIEEDATELEYRITQAAADLFMSLIDDHMKVGFSWGRTLSMLVEKIGHHKMKDIHFYPIVGGPSHIHARYHVNTLIYDLANKLKGECSFVNATIIQENVQLTKGIMSSKYFQDLKKTWNELDMVVVGVGGTIDENNPQWLDMLTKKDYLTLEQEGTVGETCCRCIDEYGNPVYPELQNRTIAIPLDTLKKIPLSMTVAYGEQKAKAILAVLRSGYLNHLVTDENTIMRILELDKDQAFQTF
ncbi:TPA: sugar-binding transcriptional regulator [Streptococcus suis]